MIKHTKNKIVLTSLYIFFIFSYGISANAESLHRFCIYSYSIGGVNIDISKGGVRCVQSVEYDSTKSEFIFGFLDNSGNFSTGTIFFADNTRTPIQNLVDDENLESQSESNNSNTVSSGGGLISSVITFVQGAIASVANLFTDNNVNNITIANSNNNNIVPQIDQSIDMKELCGREYPSPAIVAQARAAGSGNIYGKRFISGYDADWPKGQNLFFDTQFNSDSDSSPYPQEKGKVYSIRINVKDSNTSAGKYLYNISLFEGPAQDISFKRLSISKYPCDFSKDTAEIVRNMDQVPSIEFSVNDPARNNMSNIAHLKTGVYYINFANIDENGGSRLEMPSGSLDLDLGI